MSAMTFEKFVETQSRSVADGTINMDTMAKAWERHLKEQGKLRPEFFFRQAEVCGLQLDIYEVLIAYEEYLRR